MVRKATIAGIAQLLMPIVNNQPRTIQMFFDGVEVLRIEDSKKCHEILCPHDYQPDLMEMRWDVKVVYAIFKAASEVLVNRLPK